jgi:hypothetical protein
MMVLFGLSLILLANPFDGYIGNRILSFIGLTLFTLWSKQQVQFDYSRVGHKCSF